MKIRRLFYSLVILLIVAGCAEESGEVSEDDGSPESIVENARFHDLDGNEVSIGDFRGKLVLIDFWESWCGPCLQVFPAMEELRGEYPDEFEVLAVTVGLNEGPEEAREFAEEHGYDFNFLYDEYEVFTRLGGQGIPFKAIVSPEGKVISIEMGSHGRQGDYDRMKEKINEYFE
ncbi:MAG: TlpA disulfide reductase family protein [Balneolaceae bacterium]